MDAPSNPVINLHKDHQSINIPSTPMTKTGPPGHAVSKALLLFFEDTADTHIVAPVPWMGI